MSSWALGHDDERSARRERLLRHTRSHRFWPDTWFPHHIGSPQARRAVRVRTAGRQLRQRLLHLLTEAWSQFATRISSTLLPSSRSALRSANVSKRSPRTAPRSPSASRSPSPHASVRSQACLWPMTCLGNSASLSSHFQVVANLDALRGAPGSRHGRLSPPWSLRSVAPPQAFSGKGFPCVLPDYTIARPDMHSRQAAFLLSGASS